ncbi:hypothetical protein WJX73_003228 [Symbiochloris irregularis]|uniref:tRNA-uridine aminocarboxypropyltransferase n=1 Tax=Symbiochloris irregularis TaxID=706552 RepID=A0AAW1NJ28_9CHLO
MSFEDLPAVEDPPTYVREIRGCSKCGRPARVCVCSALPSQLIELTGSVLILQHPHEVRRSLGTVRLLPRCVSRLTIAVGRTIKGTSRKDAANIAGLIDGAVEQECPVLLLYPAKGATSLALFADSPSFGARLAAAHNHPSSTPPGRAYLLIALDGTWTNAREMFNALPPTWLGADGLVKLVQLPEPSANSSTVHLPEASTGLGTAAVSGKGTAAQGGETLSLPCLIRPEPELSHVTTYEAISRAVAILEHWDPSQLQKCLAPLRMMTQLQAAFNPAIHAREQEYLAALQQRELSHQ